MNPVASRRERRRSYQKSGVYTLKRAVQTLGKRALPSRSTALGRALHEWRTGLVADLGGEDGISTQQRALVEVAVRTKLMLDGVDAYVLGELGSLVNKRRRCLHPVVRERQSLANQLQAVLRDLGLERKAKPVPSIQDYIQAHAARTSSSPPPHGEEPQGQGQ